MFRIAIALLLSISAAQAEPLKITVSPHYLQPLAPWTPLCSPFLNPKDATACELKPEVINPRSEGGATSMTVLPRSYDGEGKLIK